MKISELLLGRYKITDLLPSGAQGDLVKACDRTTGNVVVVKQLNTPASATHYSIDKARFDRAGRIRINHSNVVDPIEYIENGCERFIIMPFIEGVRLSAFIASHGGKLPLDKALPILLALADALAEMHAKGVVHRDLKPDNILIRPDGNPVVIDFGICRLVNNQTITQGDGLIGTLVWCPSEQIHDARLVDHRADLYALGALAYLMLTGRMPFAGDSTEAIVKSICLDTPASPSQLESSIPPHIDQTIMCLLAKVPEARFDSAQAVKQALNGQLSAEAFCSFCGSPEVSGGAFCARCGSDLKPQGPQVRCLACSHPIEQQAMCPSCQRSFGKTPHRRTFDFGAMAGFTLAVPEGTYTVGRGELLPRDHQISRKHVKITCLNGTVIMQDAGSANGTFVGDQPAVQPVQLMRGCRIRIADNIATYTQS